MSKQSKLGLMCSECEHAFDPDDERAFIHSIEPKSHLCPLCAQIILRSTKAWAVWNDCQGVFPDEIYADRKEAQERAEVIPGDVVPVNVLVENDEDRRLFRHMEEDENEKFWGEAASQA